MFVKNLDFIPQVSSRPSNLLKIELRKPDREK